MEKKRKIDNNSNNDKKIIQRIEGREKPILWFQLHIHSLWFWFELDKKLIILIAIVAVNPNAYYVIYFCCWHFFIFFSLCIHIASSHVRQHNTKLAPFFTLPALPNFYQLHPILYYMFLNLAYFYFILFYF